MKKQEENKNVIYSLPDIFKLIKEIEGRFPVDSIKLSDGTKLWNLIRVLLYFYVQKKNANKTIDRLSIKTIYHIIKEGVSQINFEDKIELCGFSGTESRRNINGKFYDIYMDPLHDIMGEKFWIFEWPTSEAYRRDYKNKIYSKNYIPIHIPLLNKTFFQILYYKIFKKSSVGIEKKEILQDIIKIFCEKTQMEEDDLNREICEAIEIFYYIKKFLVDLLKKIEPKAIFIRCGYGRFHMALSQACRELGITSIELQHGVITNHHVGYIKLTYSNNRDCIPEYLLTYGDAFSEIVKKSTLFDHEKIISIGFPYMEEIINSKPKIDKEIKIFCSKFSKIILVTSQWDLADEIKEFILNMVTKLDRDIGIIFKPHPRDWRTYSELETYENILLVNRYDDLYEIMKIADIHSTITSTSGIEALAFGKPNIFIDMGRVNIKENIEIIDEKTSFLVNSTNQFVDKINHIISNYNLISNQAAQTSEKFFKKNSKKNFENYLKTIEIR